MFPNALGASIKRRLVQHGPSSVAFWLSLLVAGWFLATTSWICDDAFITFRSVEQLMEGNGPRWNPHERVQAFTHPLWYCAVAAVRALIGNTVLAAELLSWIISMAAYWLMARSVQDTAARILLLLALALASRSFFDYSSSGLEDPLSHLLLVLLALRLLRSSEASALDRLRAASWPSGLLLLCRHDNLWLVAPPCLWLAWRAWRTEGHDVKTLLAVAVPGFIPFAGWTLFSLVYYGFPFPNTAYAKLNTGVPGFELWPRGVDYLQNAALWDPVTVVVIAIGAYLYSRAGGVGASIAFGMTLHMLYVVRIGGDFMAGRFLSEPFVVGLIAIILLAPRPHLIPALGIVSAFVVLWPLSPLKIDDAYRSYNTKENHGIADERSYYTGPDSHLGFEKRWPVALWRAQTGPQEHFEIGFSGFAKGTSAILIDRFALADPLLARLPAAEGWKRVGHFKRSVPSGYAESVQAGKNQIENPFVHRLYDDLRLVTQGPLFTSDRWAAIWRLNLEYERPGCIDPPCRKLATHRLPPQLFAPLLLEVDSKIGGVDSVRVYLEDDLANPSPGEAGEVSKSWNPSVAVEGRVPFSLLEKDQLVRVFLPVNPKDRSLELIEGQDPLGRSHRLSCGIDVRRPEHGPARRVRTYASRWRPRVDLGGYFRDSTTGPASAPL